MTSNVFRSDASRREIERAYERMLAETPQARPRRVPTRFGDTHMLLAGPEQAPPLVVLHGAMANSALALREGHPLLSRFRVYALDVIGQSVKSADVRMRWTDYADWLLDVFDGLQLARAHLYGASSGGFIARAFAERAPDRVDRLVLLVPAGIVRGPLLRGMTRAGLPIVIYRMTGSRAALARILDATLTTPDDQLHEYLAAAFRHYRLEGAPPPLGTPEALAGFRRPTLVIAGSDDLTGPGAELLARARELFPHAALELLPGCKHIPPTDEASRAQLCALVEGFLLADDAAPRSATG